MIQILFLLKILLNDIVNDYFHNVIMIQIQLTLFILVINQLTQHVNHLIIMNLQ